jgi:hypothetical protein
MRHQRIRYLLPMVALLSVTAPVFAQQPTPRITVASQWLPFLGCWAPVNAADRTHPPLLCLAATKSIETIEMVSVLNDSIVSRQLVNGSGARTDFTREGCKGAESGSWSLNDAVFFTRAEFTCEGGQQFSSSAVLAMTSASTFSRIEGVKTGGPGATGSSSGVRVSSFVAVGDSMAIPAELRLRIPNTSATALWAARVKARAPLKVDDVVHATEYVDAPVVEAWLAANGQPFELNPSALRTLKRNAVPTSVIDMMVAVSNPRSFTLAAGGQPAARTGDDGSRGRGGTYGGLSDAEVDALLRLKLSQRSMYADPFGLGMYGYGAFNRGNWDPCSSLNYGPSAYYGGWNGCNRYGYGFGQGYGGIFFPSNQPVIIIPQPSGTGPSTGRQPGRVVNGEGYIPGGSGPSSDGGTAVPRPRVESSGGGGYFGGGGSASPSPSASTGTSPAPAPAPSSGGERTAKPRPDPR